MDSSEFSKEPRWLDPIFRRVFAIDDITLGSPGSQALRVRGRFLVPPQEAFAYLEPLCREKGYTCVFRREQGIESIYLVQVAAASGRNRIWLPVLLAILTTISVVFSYLFYWEAPELSWKAIRAGLPNALLFALPLLAILGTHEMGHYLMARHFKVAVSFPFLVPFPLSPFGTLGAVIRMRDVAPSRKALLLIGAAGPLAGLLVTLPVLIIGLSLSELQVPPDGGYIIEGNSLLYWGVKYLVFGRWLPAANLDVFIHPMAFAGWAGLLVTSMNLMPAGQLDGGHVAYALLGQSARYVMYAVLAILLVLGIWWQGWWLWAVLVFITGRSHPRPSDDLTLLNVPERVLALFLLVLFILTFTPFPMTVVM